MKLTFKISLRNKDNNNYNRNRMILYTFKSKYVLKLCESEVFNKKSDDGGEKEETAGRSDRERERRKKGAKELGR